MIDATDKSICLAIMTNVILKAIIAFSLNKKVLSIKLYRSRKYGVTLELINIIESSTINKINSFL